MKTTNKKMWKMVAGILLIIALPILFFQLMGVNIMDLEKENKRVIAIVNEDQGLTKDEETVDMGVEVVSILAQDSPYEWKVTGRGAAENGLKSNQYEAIVYIPSNFSENIMSYDQQNPVKAEFSYQIQRQKTGVRKDNVLHEIETATNRVNEKISTLYWSYIAQEMSHIKKEFANILGKETEFLTAMSDYYKPESETLAEEMNSQKDLMAGLFNTINSVNSDYNARIENAETFGQQMDGFIAYVQQYREFQGKQREILQQVQDSSLAKIQEAAAKQAEQFNQSVRLLEESNEKLNSEIDRVNEIVDANKEKFNALSELRKSEVDRQLKDLLVVQGTAIDRYNNTILGNLEKGMAASKSGTAVLGVANVGANPQEITAINEEMKQKAAQKSQAVLPTIEEEQAKVSNMLAAITSLKARVIETDPASPLTADLEVLEGELTAVQANLNEKVAVWSKTQQEGTADYAKASVDYSSLVESYQTVYNEYESIKQILNNYPADTARIGAIIKQKETALLKHSRLTEKQRTRLQKLFAQGAAKKDMESLLSYYATLEQFEFTLDEGGESTNKDALLKDDILAALLKNVVDMNEMEVAGWTNVGEGIPETELGMTNLGTTFAAIMSGYKETVEEQHAALLTELNSIDEQANLLLQQIQTPSMMIGTEEPVPATTEGEVAAGQQNVNNQLLTLSNMVNSLSQKQNSLVNYANDLQLKATDIKDTSTEFSGKWETNVDAMSEFDKDIQDFLGNTYVDGQENGYVYNHMVNPLQVKGEATLSEEGEKVPPVILFIILLISSLLIGYFTYQMKEGPIGLQLAMTAILSLLVGLIISLYSINMYVLNDQRAVEWTIFTVLLLLAGASIIRAALAFGQSAGWVASVALMCLYIIPLLILAVPDTNIPDILSKVYMSIKYEPETSFIAGASIVAGVAVVMLAVAYFMNKSKKTASTQADEAYEG